MFNSRNYITFKRKLVIYCYSNHNRSKELTLPKNLSNQINECVQYKNKIEIIISDNCSNDDTKEVVENFIEANLFKYFILRS